MLDIYRVTLAVASDLAPLLGRIAERDADLAAQTRRAWTRVALNVAEGSGLRGARRRNHYSIALGSAREAVAGIEIAVALGYLAPMDAALNARFDHVIGVLVRVT